MDSKWTGGGPEVDVKFSRDRRWTGGGEEISKRETVGRQDIERKWTEFGPESEQEMDK